MIKCLFFYDDCYYYYYNITRPIIKIYGNVKGTRGLTQNVSKYIGTLRLPLGIRMVFVSLAVHCKSAKNQKNLVTILVFYSVKIIVRVQ